MDGSSFSSLSEEESSTKQHPDTSEEPEYTGTEEQLTLITESMSVTSSDMEKLQLLNKNTELRRLNKELMKLNEEWDHIYRSTSAGLQQQLESLERENSTLRQLNGRLLLRVEHEQDKGEYYEHTLMQELKKNQHLQEHIRLLESRVHRTDVLQTCPLNPQKVLSRDPNPESTTCSAPQPSELQSSRSSRTETGLSEAQRKQSGSFKEVQDLKEQLEALRCQTKIYEDDYKTEHKDHERMMQENRRLRRREGEMRQQMALLHEQLKVYEDDFQKERSDKQILQRLLMKKNPTAEEPVLVHRCNNDQEGTRENRRNREDNRAAHVCPKHGETP